MHVAINAYFWNRPNSGSGQYTRQLVYHLNRLVSDLDITLVVPQETPDSSAIDAPPSVDVLFIPTRPGHFGKVFFEQIAFPRACKSIGADISHVPYWGSPLHSSIPVVVTVHDLTTMLVREYRRGLTARLYNALVSASARGAEHVITDSEASKKDIINHLAIAERDVTAIYLAVDKRFNPQVDLLVDMAVLRKYDLPETYVLYLGGYEIHKNVTTLLVAYTYVARALGEDYPLVLAGKPPEKSSSRFPDYEIYINDLGLSSFVRWVGYIDEEDKPAVYRGASTFAFLSRHEGFGLPPLEAMASGVPVISSKSSSLIEVVGDAGFALDPDDERQIGGAIISAIVQTDLATDMKEKGLKQAAKFSWEKTATETLLVYDRIGSAI
jgi:glycosyltransferase involved in cell wall biosynthesis